jgi:hypothetical protein
VTAWEILVHTVCDDDSGTGCFGTVHSRSMSIAVSNSLKNKNRSKNVSVCCRSNKIHSYSNKCNFYSLEIGYKNPPISNSKINAMMALIATHYTQLPNTIL